VAAKRIGLLFFLSGILFCGYAQNSGRTLEELHDAIMREPDNSLLYRERGNAYIALDQYLNALNDLSRAVILEPSAENFETRGIFLCKAGMIPDGLIDLNRAIELDEGRTHSYLMRGRVYGKLQNYNQAIADLTKVIELDPQLYGAYINRGSYFIKSGKYENGLDDMNTAIVLDPQGTPAFYWRGLAYRNLRKYHEAISDFTQTIEMMPQFVNAYISSLAPDEKITPAEVTTYCNLFIEYAYKERGQSYQTLAGQEEHGTKKAEYQKKADEDFAMATELGGTR
jgi:tetratricopeptide (TPR) repeat protein